MRRLANRSSIDEYLQYADDPVKFITEVLGERVTDDLARLANSVRDNTITLAKSANATGKTFIAARIATWFYLCHDEVQVYTAAAPPEENLKRLLWGEIGDILHRHKNIFKDDDIKSLEVRRAPLDFLVGVTIPSSGTPAERVAKFSGKHRPHLLFIVDEGDAVPDEVYEGIETCMSGGTIARLLVMFNPRAERGRVYRMERDGTANVVHLSAFNHPNVVEGRELIPGAVTRDKTVYRINKYCRRLAPGEPVDRTCFDLPDYLVGAVAKDDEGTLFAPLAAGTYKPRQDGQIFSYMVLGQYPAQSSAQLISREWIDAAVNRWRKRETARGSKPPKGVKAIQGVDMAEMGADSNATFFRYADWVSPVILWSGVDSDAGAIRCVDEYRKRLVKRACIDGTGVGSNVAPYMLRKGCTAYTVKVAGSPTSDAGDYGEFRILRDQLAWAVREWLRTNKRSMIPPDDMLIEEMLAIEYDTSKGKVKITKSEPLRDKLKRSPDRFWALAMTFFEPRPFFRHWRG